MFTKRRGHTWHMVLMAGIVVAAFWLGAGAGGALLLALLACTAMMVALVWIAVRPTRIGATDRLPLDRPPYPREAAAPRDGQRPI